MLTIERDTFAEKLAILSRIADIKMQGEFKNIALKATADGTLTLRATNGTVYVNSVISDLLVEKPFSISLEGKLLNSMVAGADTGLLELTYNKKNNQLQIKSDDMDISLPGGTFDDFPAEPVADVTKTARILAGNLKETLTKAVFATRKETVENGNPAMEGLFLNFTENQLSAYALDDHKAARRRTTLMEEGSPMKGLLAAPGVRELASILPESKEAVAVGFNQAYAIFKWTGTTVSVAIMSYPFPDMEGFLKRNSEVTTRVVLPLDKLKQIARQAEGFPEIGNNTNLRCYVDGFGNVTFTVEASQTGKYKRSLAASSFEGDENKFAFVVKNFSAVLNSLNSENVAIEWSGDYRKLARIYPIIGEGESNQDALCGVMPVHVPEWEKATAKAA